MYITPAVPTTVLYQAGLGTVTTPYVLPTTVPSIKAEVDKITAPKKKRSLKTKDGADKLWE